MLLAVLILAVVAPGAAGQCEYEVTVIEGPRSPALRQASMYSSNLNDHGDVVGFFHYTAGWHRPFLWTRETGLVELPLPPDSYEAVAEDINDAGEITGIMTHNQLGYRGFLYNDGEFTILSPVIPDAGWCKAFAISSDRTIVGYRSIANGVNPYNGYIWSAEDGFTDLGVIQGPYSSAIDLSERGVVVGWTGSPLADERVFLWQQGQLHLLGPIPGGITSTPAGVNSRNQVAGAGLVHVGRARENRWRAFLWDRGRWTLIEPLPGHDRNTARALNDLSQVVGQSGDLERAFLWQKGTTYDLNELALLDEGCTIQRAQAINNAGVIVADGDDAEWNDVTFVLTPVDRPAADIDADCKVDVADLLFLLGEWGKTNSPADIDGDGIVGFWDLLALLRDWGS